MTPLKNDSSEERLLRLRRGVFFALCLSVLSLIIALFSAFYPPLTISRIEKALSGSDSFRDLPAREKISKSSIILRTENQEVDGMIVPIIAEILKWDDGTEFYYHIGNEFPNARLRVRDSVDYGDGSIYFLQGSPARLAFGCSYRNERVSLLGGMPLKTLRKLIAEQDGAGQPDNHPEKS
jgi:hypothetical protein